jgi:hypothetical protein
VADPEIIFGCKSSVIGARIETPSGVARRRSGQLQCLKITSDFLESRMAYILMHSETLNSKFS